MFKDTTEDIRKWKNSIKKRKINIKEQKKKQKQRQRQKQKQQQNENNNKAKDKKNKTQNKTKNWQLKYLILTLFCLIFRRMYIYICINR
jgi:uncharacterized membrane protein YdbT with pleckstrin-like domain